MDRHRGAKIPCNDVQLDSPENDDCAPSIRPAREIADSQISMADKIYEALSALSSSACALLGQATNLEMTGEAMQAEPGLVKVLRHLRYPVDRRPSPKSLKARLRIVND